MEAAIEPASLKPLELRTVWIGFVLVGLAVAVTATIYVLSMTFRPQWLVWGVGAAFAAVALLALEWPRALRRVGQAPDGRLRVALLLSMPLAFILGSQVCGVGLKGCTALCHATNLAAIGLAGGTMLGVIVFMAVGNPLVGFPWEGCV